MCRVSPTHSAVARKTRLSPPPKSRPRRRALVSLAFVSFGSWFLLAGTISVTAQTNFTVLKLFQMPEGLVPVAALTDGKDGAFYGLTAAGGISNNGTIFM